MLATQPRLRSQHISEIYRQPPDNAQKGAPSQPGAPSDNRVVSDGRNKKRIHQPHLSSLWLFLSSTLFLDWALILTLIFGGCCSNVFALESIVKYESDSGLVVTSVQFLFTAAVTAWPQRRLSGKFPWILRRPKVPLSTWMVNAILFWIVNTMNNWAFGFKISVPVHIILRSGGSITTILVGSIWGRRYTKGQVLGVVLLTIGVVTAAISDSETKQNSSSVIEAKDPKSFMLGLGILFVAQVLSAVMGLYTQSIYSRYGPQWEENLLWSHMFSLLFFLPMTTELRRQFIILWNSPTFYAIKIDIPQTFSIEIPRQIFFLALNSLTQFFCIQGVNRLAARTSALGVTIALNIRKLISLLISIWIFNNQLKTGVWVGAIAVFLGGVVYAGWDVWVDGRKDRKSGKQQ